MKRLAFLVVFSALLASCAEPDRYPVSGAGCSPDDPVANMPVPPCPPA